jgi:hypothetical protein
MVHASIIYYLLSGKELPEVTIARKVLPELGINAIRKNN